MSNADILAMYKPLVPFIASICGSSCEVLLHDVNNPSNAVIAIENGFHSGRKIGSPLIAVAQQVIKEQTYKKKDYIIRYTSKDNGKELLSYTYFIKDPEENLIGALVINKDTTSIEELYRIACTLKEQFHLDSDTDRDTDTNQSYKEVLDMPASDFLHFQVKRIIDDAGVHVQRLTLDERVTLVQKMKEQGIFEMKGAVREISKQLDISEPTVYRYLNKPDPSI